MIFIPKLVIIISFVFYEDDAVWNYSYIYHLLCLQFPLALILFLKNSFVKHII